MPNYAASNSAWPGIAPSGYSKTYGPYWDLPINGRDNCINVIPNNKTNGDYQTANLKLDFTKTGAIGPIGFVFKGTDKIYYQPLAKRPQNQVELSGASAILRMRRPYWWAIWKRHQPLCITPDKVNSVLTVPVKPYSMPTIRLPLSAQAAPNGKRKNRI